MKLRGYLIVYDHCNGITGFYFSESKPTKCSGNKVYTFTIDVPHNLPELKTVEEVEEVK